MSTSTRKSGYNTYRGWTQIKYQNKHYNIDQKDEGTLDDRRRDEGTNFILRIKEQETRLTPHEHDDDDDDQFLWWQSFVLVKSVIASRPKYHFSSRFRL